jgi:hypothetical protein
MTSYLDLTPMLRAIRERPSEFDMRGEICTTFQVGTW